MSKKQWKNVTENLSLQFATKNNWSQEEVDAPTMGVNEIRSFLPTKTSATRQISDLENISQNGPFLLNFSNIPYEANEDDIKNFFRTYEIVNVIKSEHKRGAGIIEFKELNALAGALSMAEKLFFNRPIRLSIGTKDDLVRIQNAVGPRGRYPVQQRNQTSTLSEDSDNWRAKKSQPVVSQAPTENFTPKNERSNWREKQVATTRLSDEKVSSSDNADNWRRQPTRDVKSGNFNKRNQSMQDSTKPSVVTDRSETRESDLVKDIKKVSIFGEAKPVDTLSKDLEIEQKIELKKQMGDESNKTEVPPTTNAWGTKKQTNVPASSAAAPVVEKSDTLEWRGTKTSIRSKMTNNQRESPAKPEPVPAQTEPPKITEPQPAPIPVNVWTERMKSRSATVPTPAPVDRNNSATKPSLEKLPTAQSMSPENTVPASVAQHNLSGSNSAQSPPIAESKLIQKPPVVISANGPFIDPKSRTPHHSMSDSTFIKVPTAVPINKSSPSDSYKDSDFRSVSKPFSSSSEQQQPKPTAPINTCGTQNPWAKGPPKGLIEKTEVNQ